MKRFGKTVYRKLLNPWCLTTCLLILLFIVSCVFTAAYASSDSGSNGAVTDTELSATQNVAQNTDIAGTSVLLAVNDVNSDEYGDVTEQEIGEVEDEGSLIADPIEPFNRAMYHFNDKLYYWIWKPAAQGYKYIVPEEVRGLFSSFYQNIKAPVRIVNNLLQGKPGYAAIEMLRFLINSTIGVAGLRDCAKECFGVTGRDADFGQTLGKYGVGFGFYVVAPFLGPTSPRDGIGWLVDWTLKPTTYVGSSDEWFNPQNVGLFAHEKINQTSFHIGDYEIFKEAAVDPYVAMRNVYVQYRKKAIER